MTSAAISHPSARPSSGHGGAWIDLHVLAPLVKKELRDTLRNKWIVLYTIGFCVLALGLASLARASADMAGFAGFGRTAASLINLVLLLTPLMALSVGATSLVNDRERGMLSYLLAQPVTRTEVYLAKFIGLGLAMGVSILVGFGVSAMALSGASDAGLFVRMTALAFILALSMLAVGMLISAIVRRSGSATGLAVFCWLTFVLLADVGLMGAAIAFRMHIDTLFFVALANPLQAFKMAALSSFGASLDVLGPSGLWASTEFGSALPVILISSLVVWTVAPLLAGWFIFVRRPL